MLKHIATLAVFAAPAFPVFAAGGGSANWSDLFLKAANFVLLLAVLHMFAAKPAKNMIRGILGKNADELAKAEERLKNSREEHAALQKKIESLKTDLEQMKKASLLDAERNKEKTISEAKAFAQRLSEQTEARISRREREAVNKIKEVLLEESLKIASAAVSERIDSGELMKGFDKQLSQMAR